MCLSARRPSKIAEHSAILSSILRLCTSAECSCSHSECSIVSLLKDDCRRLSAQASTCNKNCRKLPAHSIALVRVSTLHLTARSPGVIVYAPLPVIVPEISPSPSTLAPACP